MQAVRPRLGASAPFFLVLLLLHCCSELSVFSVLFMTLSRRVPACVCDASRNREAAAREAARLRALQDEAVRLAEQRRVEAARQEAERQRLAAVS
jgi:hypothetical protein